MQQRIQKLIDGGFESQINEFITKLENKPKLNTELKEKLDALGNTPVLEPKLYEAINSKKRANVAKHLLTNEEILKYSAGEVADLIYATEQKVTSLTNEDGTYKSTENTRECDLPNFIECDELLELSVELHNLRDTQNFESMIELSNKIDAKVFAIAKIDKEKLTDWEKQLVTNNVMTSATNAMLSSMGKR